MIEPVSFEPVSSVEELHKEPLPLWNLIGRIELVGCTFITSGNVISGWVKKKKSMTSPVSYPGSGFSSLPTQFSSETFEEAKVPTRATQDIPRMLPAEAQRPLDPAAPAAAHVRNLFEELKCTEDDQDHIHFIITGLANGEYISKGIEMHQRGAKIETLHPFRFLWTIFSNPDLKKLMPIVFSGWITRTGFMTGVNRGMGRETPRKNLEQLQPYLEGFAFSVGTTAEAIRPLILEGAQRRDWRKFVNHLIEIPS